MGKSHLENQLWFFLSQANPNCFNISISAKADVILATSSPRRVTSITAAYFVVDCLHVGKKQHNLLRSCNSLYFGMSWPCSSFTLPQHISALVQALLLFESMDHQSIVKDSFTFSAPRYKSPAHRGCCYDLVGGSSSVVPGLVLSK